MESVLLSLIKVSKNTSTQQESDAFTNQSEDEFLDQSHAKLNGPCNDVCLF